MKKVISVIIIATIILAAFTGCTTSEILKSNTTSVEKQSVAEVSPNIFLWMDESTSISKEEMDILEHESREYIGLKNAYGPYPFGGGTYGDSTADGWTNLVEPLKASGHNSKVYIFTDGHQENPGGFNQRSFAGPYWGLEIHYVCIAKNAYTQQLRESLENSKEYFKGSTVILEYLDGSSRDVIIDEFEEQEYNVSYEDQDTLYSLSKKESKIPWWLWLLPLLLLLIPLLWWILKGRKKDEDTVTDADAEPNRAIEGTPAASGGTASAGTPVSVVEPSRLTTRPTSEIDGAIAPTPVEPESSPTATTIPKAPESKAKCCYCCPYMQQKKNNTLAIVAIACVAIVAIASVALILATI